MGRKALVVSADGAFLVPLQASATSCKSYAGQCAISFPQKLGFDGANTSPTNVEWRGHRKLHGAFWGATRKINDLAEMCRES